MKKTTTNRNFLRIGAVLVLTAFWVMLPFMMNGSTVEADGDSDVRIRASLSGAAIGGVSPSGFAEHRFEPDDSGERRRLEVQLSSVNLPNGTLLDIYVSNAFVGRIVINNGFGFVEFDTNNGQSVPNASNGTPIAVRQGTSDVVTGVFGIFTPSPSPSGSPNASPSASPSGSPNPSPSASPTGSPNPSPSATPTGSPNPSPSVSPTASPNPTASPSPTGSPNPSPSPNAGDLFAVLSGATVNGVLPNGFAQYEIHSSRRELEIEVNQVNLPAGTQLAVTVDNVAVGQLFLESDGRGKLRLRSDNGQFVPVVVSGSTIVLRNGGATILSGVFGGGVSPSPSPSASPSASPTGSPNPNPTASPSPSASASPSASPSQGRFFEARVTGSQMIPPVTTGATGQIRILLNQSENQATVTGAFQNLSSAQTSAKIFLTAGDTSVVQDLGTVGGTSGNLATVTISVNQLQAAQIRAGSWFAIIGTVNNPNGEIGGRFTKQSGSSDFDGDGSNDFAVFRPTNGVWYTQNSQGFGAQVLGNAGDKLISGDYDGDGRTDAAVFRNVNGLGVWEIRRSSDSGITSTAFGYATDTAVRGDFDGDGRNDLAVYRQSNGTWYIQRSGGAGFTGVRFGASEDKPVAADFDGDGKADIAVFRPSNGVWYWIRSVDGGIGASAWGQAGDIPIAGDFDGDGKADVSVFRPSDGVWYIWRSSNGTYDFRRFGTSEDVPVAGNYDGDNKTDIAVFRPSNGIWYIWRSVDGTYDYRLFGQNGDIPTPVR
jgi:hypothetical protein